jgi:hypothetical protein
VSEKTETIEQSGTGRRTTVVYGKVFAFIGIFAGLAMVFGTPGVLLLFHQGLDSSSREWVESLPRWTAPTMLCIGMGGGVLISVFSACFGLLIPSRVIREAANGRSCDR